MLVFFHLLGVSEKCALLGLMWCGVMCCSHVMVQTQRELIGRPQGACVSMYPLLCSMQGGGVCLLCWRASLFQHVRVLLVGGGDSAWPPGVVYGMR